MIGKEGDRIELVSLMADDPDPIPVGSQGVITWIGDLGDYVQIGVEWDSGRTLGLVCPPDRYRVLPT